MNPKPYARAYIEITNACGLACSFCPSLGRPFAAMPPETFARALEQAAPLARQASFHLMGDPLAHPKLGEYLDLAGRADLPITLTTAGHLLTPGRIETLLHPAVRQVNFSLNSYNENPQKISLDAYLDPLAAFVDDASRRRPDLYINWRLWNLGDPSSEPFNDAVFAYLRSRFALTIASAGDPAMKKGKKLIGRFYLHGDSLFEWPSPALPERTERGFCHALTGQFGILSDGRVVPCCLDREGTITLGNIRDTPLRQILDSPRAQAMREGFAARTLVEPLCRTCGYISRFDRK